MKAPALKFLILRLLEEGPKSGYEIIKDVENLLGSSYPGSIYPLLRWWEERGFIEKKDKYYLTTKGKEFLEELEKRRNEYVERVKRDLLALARALNDPEMEKLVSFLPLRERIGDEGMFLLAHLISLLTECKEDLLKGLKQFLTQWEELCQQ